jgi:hypothetical protein
MDCQNKRYNQVTEMFNKGARYRIFRRIRDYVAEAVTKPKGIK